MTALDAAKPRSANKASDEARRLFQQVRRGGPEQEQDFLVLLDDIEPAVRLWAASHALDYRNINESYRARTWSRLSEALPPLVVVENSPWIAWLKEESGGVLDEVELTHYAIFTPEDCIDVVSELSPQVEWLNESLA